MFKIFKNRVFSFTFTLLILFFVQIIEENASFVQNQFQEVGIVATLEKNIVTEAVGRAVIHDIEKQNGFYLVKGIGIGKNKGNDKGNNNGSYGFGLDFVDGVAVMVGGLWLTGFIVSACIGNIIGTTVSLLGVIGVLNYIGDRESES
ncbi:hypothetical protein [Bartonella gabonensis]|uniref:hypothetical protein n=1 Tax=Bartonella gabonensis TaxID=2699889 RepID=UPI00158F233A|nr:hypothetical protein [Bartonella gabonensis]